MNLITKIIPERLFRSFLSTFSSSTSSPNLKPGSGGGAADFGTPTSIVPEISDGWYDNSFDFYFKLVQAFKQIDSNNDGILSRSELEELLSRLRAEPPSQEELRMMLSGVDGDGDGCISFDALMSWVVGSAFEPACDSELRETFDFFDKDHDGKITVAELLGAFSAIRDVSCSLDDCRRMIEVVDKNGEGFVCFVDFSRMMEQQI